MCSNNFLPVASVLQSLANYFGKGLRPAFDTTARRR